MFIPSLKSNWLGSNRQTESSYNYQTHHHQWTVVDPVIKMSNVEGERATLIHDFHSQLP